MVRLHEVEKGSFLGSTRDLQGFYKAGLQIVRGGIEANSHHDLETMRVYHCLIIQTSVVHEPELTQ